MEDWFTKSTCSDISFCNSDCKNIDCDRNMNGYLMNKMKNNYKIDPENNYFIYSASDFHEGCSSYV